MYIFYLFPLLWFTLLLTIVCGFVVIVIVKANCND